MIRKLKKLWKTAAASPVASQKHELSLAVTALMVEIMRVDDQLLDVERNEIMARLRQRFALSQADLHALIARAEDKVEQALDMQQFTSVVVKGFGTGERVDILVELWGIANADGVVDPYEEQLIRRMADLMGLHHSQFIQAKVTAGVA